MANNNHFLHPRWLGLFLTLDFIGLALFLLGLQPWLFGLGFVVIASFAIEKLLRPPGQPLTIREDVGARLAATGYVLAAVSSTADLIGLGSHPLPGSPHLGTLQSIGLIFGAATIVVGLAMYHPRKTKSPKPEP